MRALAEWIMHGPTQARIATVALASFPLLLVWIEAGTARAFAGFAATGMLTLSAAALGLVTLRRGLTQGASLMAWALLPCVVWLLWRDETSPLVLVVTTTALAAVLRQSVSWSRTLVIATSVGVLISALLGFAAPQTVTELRELAQQMADALGGNDPRLAALVTPAALHEILLGGLVAGHLGSAFVSLVIARWWQAQLYQPGGLKAELHQLRLPPLFAGLALVVLIAGSSLDQLLLRCLPLVVVPLLVAGVALVHAVVAKRELGRSWLVAFYSATFIAGPYLISLLVLLAAIDSLIDIRKRIPAKS